MSNLYSTLSRRRLSSSPFVSFVPGLIGVLTGFELSILNIFSMLFVYASHPIQTSFECGFRTTLTPRKWYNSPMPFVLNSSAGAYFISFIFWILFPAKRIPSTYTATMNFPPHSSFTHSGCQKYETHQIPKLKTF